MSPLGQLSIWCRLRHRLGYMRQSIFFCPESAMHPVRFKDIVGPGSGEPPEKSNPPANPSSNMVMRILPSPFSIFFQAKVPNIRAWHDGYMTTFHSFAIR